MSEQNTGQGPSLEILLQYIKDCSVENPSPLDFLKANQEEIDTRMEVDVQAGTLQESEYEVILMLRVQIQKGEKPLYVLELQYAGRFRITNANEEMLQLLLFVQCPHLLFPYMRSLVTLLTQESGFPALNLQPIDFLELLRRRAAQQTEGGIIQP